MKKAHLHLIKWGLAKGYHIAVYGEGQFGLISDKYKEVKDEVEACDIGSIIFIVPNEAYSVHGLSHYLNNTNGRGWKRIASFDYVLEFDQVPDESIYDYGINDVSEAWAHDYDAHCEVA